MLRFFLATLLCVTSVATVAADAPKTESTVNLAERINDSVSIPAGTLRIVIVNLAPANVTDRLYDVSTESYTVDPPGIDTSNVFKAEQSSTPPVDDKAKALLDKVKKATPPNGLLTTESPTEKLARLVGVLALERDEIKVPGEVAQVRAAMADVTDKNDLAGAQQILDVTTKTIDIDALAIYQGVILNIHRGPEPNVATMSWRREYHVGGPGKFVSNYVFGFAPKHDDEYFSDPVSGQSGQFTITKSRRHDNVGYVPLVLFSWIPASKGNEARISGPTAGLGYDLSNLVVAAGYLWTWHRNLGFTVGILGQQQRRLKGKYHENEPIGQNLESNDLTEPVWRPNVFIGISIRSVGALFR